MKGLILSFFSLDFESSISMQNISMTDIGYSDKYITYIPTFFLYSENAA